MASKCGCPSGTTKKSTKGRGLGFACLGEGRMPRLVKAKSNGSCPEGAKKKKMGKSGTRCVKMVTGKKFVAPVGCGSRSGKSRSKKKRRKSR